MNDFVLEHRQISPVALNSRRWILVKSLFSTLKVGGGRSSRLSRILYSVFHDSEQIEVGGCNWVFGTFLRHFLPILGNRRKNATIL